MNKIESKNDLIKRLIIEVVPYVVIFALVVLLKTYIVTPVLVHGQSMEPTLKNNQFLLLKKYDRSFDRYDIVVINYNGEKLIKRVMGLPGESLEYKSGRLYINGEEVKDEFSSMTGDFNIIEFGAKTIPEDCYIVLGDNRLNSVDSRIIGFVDVNDLDGITNFSIYPFNTFGKID